MKTDEKAQLIQSLTRQAASELILAGAYFRFGYLRHSNGDVMKKPFLCAWLMQNFGHVLKPSEVERELYPSVIASITLEHGDKKHV